MASSEPGFELDGEATPIRELLRDLKNSWPLVLMLAKKDFFVRYRRASFGLLWAVTLPLFQASVLCFVFSQIVSFRGEVPYPVFVLPAYIAWSYFASTLPAASTAIVDNAGLSNKIYFARAVLPMTSIVSNLYGFAMLLVAVIGSCVVFGVNPGFRIMLLVPATALLVALTTTMSLVLSALHVYFRDVRFFLQAALSVWLFVTPILYPLDRIDGVARTLIQLNPMTGVAELFRAAVTGEEQGWALALAASGVWTVGLGATALVLHGRYNRVFSDLL